MVGANLVGGLPGDGQEAKVSWLSFLQAGKMLTALESVLLITSLAAEAWG